jgi:hypothetical protein
METLHTKGVIQIRSDSHGGIHSFFAQFCVVVVRKWWANEIAQTVSHGHWNSSNV